MNDSHPDNTADTIPEPPRLRLLRLLVTTLTATLIIGFVIIVGLLVTMVLGRKAPAVLVTPEEITLPAGESAVAFTRGTNWVALVTRDTQGKETIRIYSPGGKTLQTIPIKIDGDAE